MTKNKSLESANERRLVGYPNNRLFALFIAHCHYNGVVRAEMVTKIIEKELESISDSKKTEYLNLFKTLSKTDIKRIGKKIKSQP